MKIGGYGGVKTFFQSSPTKAATFGSKDAPMSIYPSAIILNKAAFPSCRVIVASDSSILHPSPLLFSQTILKESRASHINGVKWE